MKKILAMLIASGFMLQSTTASYAYDAEVESSYTADESKPDITFPPLGPGRPPVANEKCVSNAFSLGTVSAYCAGALESVCPNIVGNNNNITITVNACTQADGTVIYDQFNLKDQGNTICKLGRKDKLSESIFILMQTCGIDLDAAFARNKAEAE